MLKTLTRIINSADSIERDEYLNSVNFSRKFTARDVWNDAKGSCPDILKLTAGLISSGKEAWGIPEFESALYDVMLTWVVEGQLIKAQLLAQSLVDTAEGSSKEWLTEFAAGNFFEHLDRYQLKRQSLGETDCYLYPLRLNHLIAAQQRADSRKVATLA